MCSSDLFPSHDRGATVPFISRYRKERTGTLDEVQVAEIKHYVSKFDELEKRKEAVLKSIEEQGKLNDSLRKEIVECVDSQRLEDLYLPYRPKRRTKATIAKEKGLEPLADTLMTFKAENVKSIAKRFLGKDVKTEEDALSGARDIIAERISEKIEVREDLRTQYIKFGKIVSKAQKGIEDVESSKFKNYFDYTGSIYNIPAHRLLAILRGVNDGELQVKVSVEQDYCLNGIRRFVYPKGERIPFENKQQIEEAIEDSYKRLLHPSVENESLKIAKEKADIESIRVFGENLTALLLAPPLGQKRVLAIDPGFRTGCKIVCYNFYDFRSFFSHIG